MNSDDWRIIFPIVGAAFLRRLAELSAEKRLELGFIRILNKSSCPILSRLTGLGDAPYNKDNLHEKREHYEATGL